MKVILNKLMWADNNNVGVELTRKEIFALCGDIEGFLINKGIISKGVQVE
jgi:hypothetical protein